MAYIRQVAASEATGALKKIYDAAIQRMGGVPNIVKLMGLEPRVLQSSMQLYMNAIKTPGALGFARREMLATVVSNANDCYY